MKKLPIIFVLTVPVTIMVFTGCGNVKRHPGAIYMPDMAYSRAYETYIERDSTKFTTDIHHTDDRIFYSGLPVTGTIAREEMTPFPYSKDAPGDSTNYVASKQVPNPLPPLSVTDMKEAERIYLINCGICHGQNLDGNGPLYKGGQGPYAAAPRNLASDPYILNMPDGQMYYSITYGKNLMGPYESQVNRRQGWMIIHYIRSKQSAAAKGASSDTTKNTTK